MGPEQPDLGGPFPNCQRIPSLGGQELPTSNLVLPMVWGSIESLDPSTVITKFWDGEQIALDKIDPAVAHAREQLWAKMTSTWKVHVVSQNPQVLFHLHLTRPTPESTRFPWLL